MNKRQRWFVALFDYDPTTMSPNPDACEEELPFSEGDNIKVLIPISYPTLFLFNIYVILLTVLIKFKLNLNYIETILIKFKINSFRKKILIFLLKF